MFDLPKLDRNNLENEESFDVDALPDMDEEAENDFIDILQEKKKLADVQKKHELTLPKDLSLFKDAYYKSDGKKLTLHFKLEKKDLQNMAKVTYGLFSTDVNTGKYDFEVADTEDENIKEIYYYDEFSGEIIDGEVKIYKRYFFTAIVRSLVKQEILFEHEANKFTINPAFFIKLQVHSASVAEELSRRGFPIVDVEEYKKMREFEDEIKEPVTAKEEEVKVKATDLF
ncbi:MAG: hypothetical protein PHF25_07760 [Candidatus Margulisbacteria bacterium]|nr:hypothetical protein [Candidatus Margulisiibacteriota bacterium]